MHLPKDDSRIPLFPGTVLYTRELGTLKVNDLVAWGKTTIIYSLESQDTSPRFLKEIWPARRTENTSLLTGGPELAHIIGWTLPMEQQLNVYLIELDGGYILRPLYRSYALVECIDHPSPDGHLAIDIAKTVSNTIQLTEDIPPEESLRTIVRASALPPEEQSLLRSAVFLGNIGMDHRLFSAACPANNAPKKVARLIHQDWLYLDAKGILTIDPLKRQLLIAAYSPTSKDWTHFYNGLCNVLEQITVVSLDHPPEVIEQYLCWSDQVFACRKKAEELLSL